MSTWAANIAERFNWKHEFQDSNGVWRRENLTFNIAGHFFWMAVRYEAETRMWKVVCSQDMSVQQRIEETLPARGRYILKQDAMTGLVQFMETELRRAFETYFASNHASLR